jgi:hypothetical protein
MGVSKQQLLLLEYNAGLVPEGGAAVLCQLGAPVPCHGKEAAGHLFHEFALRQSGLLSELPRPRAGVARATQLAAAAATRPAIACAVPGRAARDPGRRGGRSCAVRSASAALTRRARRAEDPEPEDAETGSQDGKSGSEPLSRSSSQAIDDQPPPG